MGSGGVLVALKPMIGGKGESLRGPTFFMQSIQEITKNPAIDIALDTIAQNKQTLIFTNSKRGAEKTAEDISKKNPKINLTQLSDKILTCLPRPTKQCERLANCVKRGVAFHHAGLHYKQREIIENEFRAGTIKAIAATPTLALGCDTPAFRCIIKDLKRFTGLGQSYIPVLEYLQMAGRAGRPGKEDFGEAIILAATEPIKQELHEKYITGLPESIYSKLAVEPVLRTYILSLITTNVVKTKEDLIKFFNKTFWAHQFHDMNRLNLIINKMTELLKKYRFIVSNQDDDFVIPNQQEVYNPTILGKRVAELYIDPLTANYLLETFEKYDTHDEFALLHAITHTLEMRPLLKVKVREIDWINSELLKRDELLTNEPDIYDYEYDEFMDSIKTALCLHEWMNECDEEYLLEKYAIRPGEIHTKLERADWLIYSCTELTRIKKQKNLNLVLSKLRARLKYGVKSELLPLLQLKNIGRIRARKLHKNNIKDIKAIKNIDITTLSQILGQTLALNIKQQVGQKVNILKEINEKSKTSQGQLSLTKF